MCGYLAGVDTSDGCHDLGFESYSPGNGSTSFDGGIVLLPCLVVEVLSS